MEEGNGRFKNSQGKSSGNVLGVFYRLLPIKDHVIEEKEYYKEIGVRGFDYSLFEEKKDGGEREGLDGSPYLKHLIKLWPGDW